MALGLREPPFGWIFQGTPKGNPTTCFLWGGFGIRHIPNKTISSRKGVWEGGTWLSLFLWWLVSNSLSKHLLVNPSPVKGGDGALRCEGRSLSYVGSETGRIPPKQSGVLHFLRVLLLNRFEGKPRGDHSFWGCPYFKTHPQLLRFWVWDPSFGQSANVFLFGPLVSPRAKAGPFPHSCFFRTMKNAPGSFQ